MTRDAIPRYLVAGAPTIMCPPSRTVPLLLLALLTSPVTALAQRVDLTVFAGGAYPVYDDRLTLRPSIPSLPGVTVTTAGSPELRADGGVVFGGALAFEVGVLALEGRFDSAAVGLNLVGGRFDLRGASVPFEGITASVGIGDGRFDADRLHLFSGNIRVRTPGPIGLVASGGVSYLRDVTITGSVPLTVQAEGITLPPISPRIRLRAAPDESTSRFGVNVGAGLRVGGSRLALMAEARVFYFRDYELRFEVDDAPALLNDVLDSIDPIRFEPVIVNAQAGIVLKF